MYYLSLTITLKISSTKPILTIREVRIATGLKGIESRSHSHPENSRMHPKFPHTISLKYHF